MSTRRPVTNSDVHEWIRLYSTGKSIRDICAVTGRSSSTIHRRIRTEVEMRPHGVRYSGQYSRFPLLTETERLMMRRLYLPPNSMSIRKIMMVTGRSYGAIYGALQRMGVPMRSRGGQSETAHLSKE